LNTRLDLNKLKDDDGGIKREEDGMLILDTLRDQTKEEEEASK